MIHLQKGKKPSHADNSQGAKSVNKSGKRKINQESDNFTGIKNKKSKKDHPQLGKLVLQNQILVKDPTTRDQREIEEHSELYLQSRENSPPRSPKKKKRKRKTSISSIGSDASLSHSKSPPGKSDEKFFKKFDKKKRTRKNSQGDKHDVPKTSDRKLTKKFDKKGGKLNILNQGDSSPTSNLHSKGAEGDNEEKEGEPKKKKRKRKPRKNKFKDLEGNVKSEFKTQSHSADEQGSASNASTTSQKSQVATRVRTDGSIHVKKEINDTKHKNKLSSKNNSDDAADRNIPSKRKDHSLRVKKNSGASNGHIDVKKDLTSTQKDPQSPVNNSGNAANESSHVKRNQKNNDKSKSFARNIQPNTHKGEQLPIENSGTAAGGSSHMRKDKKKKQKNQKSAEFSIKSTNKTSYVKKNGHKNQDSAESSYKMANESSHVENDNKNKHNDQNLAKSPNKAGSDQVETSHQDKGVGKHRRTHRRPNKGRKRQPSKPSKPKATPANVKPKEVESESEEEGEKVLESVNESEGLLQRVSRVKKDEKKQQNRNTQSEDDGKSSHTKLKNKTNSGSSRKQNQKPVDPQTDSSSDEDSDDFSDEDSDDSSDEPQHQKRDSSGDSKGQSQRSRLENQLMASHFRFLNEKFYLCSGSEAYEMMAEDMKAFEVRGFPVLCKISSWQGCQHDFAVAMCDKRRYCVLPTMQFFQYNFLHWLFHGSLVTRNTSSQSCNFGIFCH